jgi:hypothetical protein
VSQQSDSTAPNSSPPSVHATGKIEHLTTSPLGDADESAGGLIFFEGGNSVALSWESLLDVANLGNNSANRIEPVGIQELGFTNIDRVVVEVKGSGAIDNLVITPEPSATLLLAVGLLGLGVAGRRR